LKIDCKVRLRRLIEKLEDAGVLELTEVKDSKAHVRKCYRLNAEVLREYTSSSEI